MASREHRRQKKLEKQRTKRAAAKKQATTRQRMRHACHDAERYAGVRLPRLGDGSR